MQTALIVLNFNGINDTLACLDSLKKINSKMSNYIIVVDNASQDDSLAKLSKIKNIELLKNHKNLGFSAGMNVGIKYALKKGFDAVIILNNDTIVDENFLKDIEGVAKKADIISPMIYFYPGYEFHKDKYKKSDLGKVIWYGGGVIDWNNIIGQHVNVDKVAKEEFKKDTPTDFATGACMFIKREVFEKIGFFDESYFLYLEDMDFCVRAKKAGYKIMVAASARVWHKNAQSTGGSGSNYQDFYISRNRIYFASKFASLKTQFAVLKQLILQRRFKASISGVITSLKSKFI